MCSEPAVGDIYRRNSGECRIWPTERTYRDLRQHPQMFRVSNAGPGSCVCSGTGRRVIFTPGIAGLALIVRPVDEGAQPRDAVCPHGAGKQTVVADAVETIGQHVEQQARMNSPADMVLV